MFKVKSKFELNPAFFIILIWLFVACGTFVAINYFFAILLHELGHFFVAKLCGYKLSKFSLSPYGVGLSYYGVNIEERDEIFIALAGPLFNFLSSFFMTALWWIFPSTYFWTYGFVETSLIIALSNLLPAYPLDGGRIFVSLSSKFINRKKAMKITIFFNFFISFLCFLLFIIFCFINFNPTFLLFGVFLILGILDLKFISMYEKISFFSKQIKNFSRPRLYTISSNVTLGEILKRITTSRSSFFFIVNEDGRTNLLSDTKIFELSLKYDLKNEIGEILKNYENIQKNYEILLKNALNE